MVSVTSLLRGARQIASPVSENYGIVSRDDLPVATARIIQDITETAHPSPKETAQDWRYHYHPVARKVDEVPQKTRLTFNHALQSNAERLSFYEHRSSVAGQVYPNKTTLGLIILLVVLLLISSIHSSKLSSDLKTERAKNKKVDERFKDIENRHQAELKRQAKETAAQLAGVWNVVREEQAAAEKHQRTALKHRNAHENAQMELDAITHKLVRAEASFRNFNKDVSHKLEEQRNTTKLEVESRVEKQLKSSFIRATKANKRSEAAEEQLKKQQAMAEQATAEAVAAKKELSAEKTTKATDIQDLNKIHQKELDERDAKIKLQQTPPQAPPVIENHDDNEKVKNLNSEIAALKISLAREEKASEALKWIEDASHAQNNIQILRLQHTTGLQNEGNNVLMAFLHMVYNSLEGWHRIRKEQTPQQETLPAISIFEAFGRHVEGIDKFLTEAQGRETRIQDPESEKSSLESEKSKMQADLDALQAGQKRIQQVLKDAREELDDTIKEIKKSGAQHPEHDRIIVQAIRYLKDQYKQQSEMHEELKARLFNGNEDIAAKSYVDELEKKEAAKKHSGVLWKRRYDDARAETKLLVFELEKAQK